MGRPRKFVIDPSTGKTVEGLSLHRSSGHYYYLDETGKRRHLGKDRERAILSYSRVAPNFLDKLARARARRGRLSTPEGAAEMIEGVQTYFEAKRERREAEASTEPVSEALPEPKEGELRDLSEGGEAWAADKDDLTERTRRDALGYWNEFVAYASKKGVTAFAQLNRSFFTAYEQYMKKKTRDKGLTATYYGNRFRWVRAMLRHILESYELTGVTESQRGSLYLVLKKLKVKQSKGSNRKIERAELHALLATCDKIAAKPLPTVEAPKLTKEYPGQLVKLQKAQHARYLAIELKAMYLVAINLAYYPVDLADFRFDMIDDKGHVIFTRGKTGVPRVGQLLPATREALDAWLEVRKETDNDGASDRVFVTTIGTKWTPAKLHERLKAHVKDAGLDAAISWKMFRKGTIAATYSDDRIDDKFRKWVCGHAGRREDQIVDSYVDPDPALVGRVIKAIGKVYGL